LPCNAALAAHPTVQVSPDVTCGILGIINGYCGTIDDGAFHGLGPIAAVSVDGEIVRFVRTEEIAP
jgi:hypothetical protein